MENRLVSIVVVTRNRKADLFDCLTSLHKQTYKNIEIIVVDNASDEIQEDFVKKYFPEIIVVRSRINLGGAGGRNLGIKFTKGEFLLFIDDDAVADDKLVEELLISISHKKAGVVQPKIYDKDKPRTFQGLGHGVNFYTGKVYGIAIRETDKGQYEDDFEIPMAGCCWMVKRKVINKIGVYDEDYFIPYEDTDFSWRAHRAGFTVLLSAKAKVWHQGPKTTSLHGRLQWLGITTPDKAYRLTRNKIIFMSKHAPALNLIIFFIIFVPIYNITHALVIISTGKIGLLPSYWKGVASGIIYFVRHRLL